MFLKIFLNQYRWSSRRTMTVGISQRVAKYLLPMPQSLMSTLTVFEQPQHLYSNKEQGHNNSMKIRDFFFYINKNSAEFPLYFEVPSYRFIFHNPQLTNLLLVLSSRTSSSHYITISQ